MRGRTYVAPGSGLDELVGRTRVARVARLLARLDELAAQDLVKLAAAARAGGVPRGNRGAKGSVLDAVHLLRDDVSDADRQVGRHQEDRACSSVSRWVEEMAELTAYSIEVHCSQAERQSHIVGAALLPGARSAPH